jgi:Tol biopolymer transport system component
MTTERRFDRELPELLARLDEGPMPDYRDFVVRQTATMRQRPAWTFPERWLPMDITTRRLAVARPVNWRLLAVAAVVLLAVVAAALVAAGSRPRLPAPPYGPAANGLIAYESLGDIWLGDPDSATSRPIVAGAEVDTVPRFSRDGTKLFFMRLAPFSGHQLMLADPDGTHIRAASPEIFSEISGGDWSGDGRFLLIASRVGGRQTMSIIDTVDGSVRRIDVGMEVFDPTFRPPNGRQIAFSVGEGSRAAIYVVETDGGAPVKLADGGGPVYSPDGSRIAYGRSYQPAVAANETRVMNADGSDDHIVGDRPDVQYQGTPVWSPDGTRLLVFRNSQRTGQVLAVVPADGSDPGREFHVAFVGGFGGLAWSPDGSLVVATPADETAEATLLNVVDGTSHYVPRWYVETWQRLPIESSRFPTPAPAGR